LLSDFIPSSFLAGRSNNWTITQLPGMELFDQGLLLSDIEYQYAFVMADLFFQVRLVPLLFQIAAIIDHQILRPLGLKPGHIEVRAVEGL